MAYEHREGQGSLFKNDKKTEEDRSSRLQQGGSGQRPSYQAPSPAPYQAPVEDDLPAGLDEMEDLPF